MKKLVFAIFAAVFLCSAVTGCHTVRGAGEDVEDVGHAVQNATP